MSRYMIEFDTGKECEAFLCALAEFGDPRSSIEDVDEKWVLIDDGTEDSADGDHTYEVRDGVLTFKYTGMEL